MIFSMAFVLALCAWAFAPLLGKALGVRVGPTEALLVAASLLVLTLAVWLVRPFYAGVGILLALSQFLASAPSSTGVAALHVVGPAIVLIGVFSCVPRIYLHHVRQRTPRQRAYLRAGVVAGAVALLGLIIGVATSPLVLAAALGAAVVALVGSLGLAYQLYRVAPRRTDLVFNRILVYTALAGLLLGIYSVGVTGISNLVGVDGWGQLATEAGLAIGVAVSFGPLRGVMQKLVDWLFYGGWYNYRTVIRATSAELHRATSVPELVEQVVAAARAMRFEFAALLWPDAAMLELLYAREDPRVIPGTLKLPRTGALATRLLAATRPVTSAELAPLPGGAPSERALAADSHVSLWVPLVGRDTFYGALLLGQRQGDAEIDAEDLDILKTLAAQAAVAAENVLLVAALRARVLAMEQIQHELIETRQRLVDGCESTRLLLAQELHDGPIQDLYGLSFQLQAVAVELDNPAHSANLAQAQAQGHAIARAIRAICFELRPPTLAPFGLEAAIRSHSQLFTERHPDLDVQLDLAPDGQMLSQRARLALFRIYQETLNNITQHAQASCAVVRFTYDAQRITLEVRDDGCSFDVPQNWIELVRQGHIGLVGSRERAESLGGTLIVQSSRDSGTLVRASIPRAPNQDWV